MPHRRRGKVSGIDANECYVELENEMNGENGISDCGSGVV